MSKQTENKKGNKKEKKIVVYTKKEMAVRRAIITILMLISLSCLGYFGFYAYSSYQTQKESERLARISNNETINNMYSEHVEEEEVEGEIKRYVVLEKYNSLFHQNQNLIGWLKIADTNIDYPVYQTGNNEYYLSHNSSLEEDKNGALFMDKDCDIKERSTNLIIYGHNMRSGKMFGDLNKYQNESFYQNHKTIKFDTIYEEGEYEVMYVFRSKVYTQEEVVFKYYQFIDAFSEEEFNSDMKEMKALSLYDTGVEATYGDELLTLSTCDYEEEDGRFVVVARRIS